MAAGAGLDAGRTSALTTSVDLFATLTDVFGASAHVRQRTHGMSLMPLLSGESASVRDHVLAGVWGREVHLIDANWKYARAPADRNAPLPMMSNRWSTMPTHHLTRAQEIPLPDGRARLGRMPGSDVPVIHQTFQAGDKVPFWAYATFSGEHVYDLVGDPDERVNLRDTPAAKMLAERLRAALEAIEAPREQFERLGFA